MADVRSDCEALVAVARVLRPRGILGEAFLAPLTDFPERFQELGEVLLDTRDGSRVSVRIAYVRTYGHRLAVKFRGVETPEDVSGFRGSTMLIPRQAVYPLPDDTFYVFEIVGLNVETEAGEVVGKVVDVLSLPGNDVYVVDREGKEILLPAVRDLVSVDVEAGRVVVRNLEGLL